MDVYDCVRMYEDVCGCVWMSVGVCEGLWISVESVRWKAVRELSGPYIS